MGVGVEVSGAECLIRLGLPPSLPFSALALALRFDFRDPRREPMLIGWPQWGQVVFTSRTEQPWRRSESRRRRPGCTE